MIQQKLKERGLARRNGQHLSSAVLNLDVGDLPTTVNGTDTDEVKDEPFDLHLTKDKGKDWFCSPNKKLFAKQTGEKGALATQQGCSPQRLTVAVQFARRRY